MNKLPIPLLGLGFIVLSSCATQPSGSTSSSDSAYTAWTVGAYRTEIPHAPSVAGWRQVKSVGVKFREYEISTPSGKWILSAERPGAAIQIFTPSGKRHDFKDEWYPEEGGADSAAAYGFVKDGETLIVLQGTSALTYEETHFRFQGEELADVRRYASKGAGMGPDAPGVEPHHRVYPPGR